MVSSTVIRTPTLRPPTARLVSTNCNSSFQSPKLLMCVSFRQRHTLTCPIRCRIYSPPPPPHPSNIPLSRRPLLKFLPFASHGETTETETQTQTDEKEEDLQQSEIQADSNGDVVENGASEGDIIDSEEPASPIIAMLQSYKQAFASNDESKVAEIEAFLSSIEDEKIDLDRKVATLSEELSYEKDRILRISADFDNFRKRTERERLTLVTNAQGEVVENLLPVLDNFERAKTQIKVETEGEEKINNSYQSISKQFTEILVSLGVVPVETIGKPFDPLLHEAIMREDSTEFEEGIVIAEFRKGFKLGDRLLRPSMVKVSAGPGPTKVELVEPSTNEPEIGSITGEEGSSETESAEE